MDGMMPGGHSELGASGAERWMNCAGSVTLVATLDRGQSDEEDYQVDGTAAHEAGAYCLDNTLDAWEIIGQKFNRDQVEADGDMAEALQLYLDTVRADLDYPGAPFEADVGAYGTETRFHRPELHPKFYGTIDRWSWHPARKLLIITDYKHGEGIAVDVEWNPQIMYYAYGKLQEYPEAETILLRIVQPRAFHIMGRVREWEISAFDLRAWAEEELLPKMRDHEMNGDLQAGPWCRFCPAKLACPLLTGLFGAAAKANLNELPNLSDESLGRSYALMQGVSSYNTALAKEVFRRLSTGKEMPGAKLVAKKANRVWKGGAVTVLSARLGKDRVYTDPEPKSPAEIEKLGPEAKELVKEYAYTPTTGLTVARADDKRPAVKVLPGSETFKYQGEK